MRDGIVKKDINQSRYDAAHFRQNGILSIEHVRPFLPDVFYRRFPVPWITLVISLGTRGWWRNADTNWRRFPPVCLRGHGGLWSFGRDEPGKAEYVKILLDPCHFYSAFGISAAEVVGATIDVSDIPQFKGLFDVDRLVALKEGDLRVELVTEELASKLASRPTLTSQFDINDILSEIRVTELATNFDISARTFRNQVRRSIGLTPKSWMRMARFAGALRTLHSNANECVHIEYPDLYFDQSHMIHEFRQFTGTTPSIYQRSKSSGNLRPYMMLEKSPDGMSD